MIKYIHDSDVEEKLNDKIIQLFTICFARHSIIRHQRYFKEMPQHRWYIEDDNKLIAHLALHEKKISSTSGEFPIGGVAEVCVHPDHRGKGYVKQMLKMAHKWLQENKYPFAMLFGDKKIYSSSGYSVIENEIKYFDDKIGKWKSETSKYAMIKALNDKPWPEGLININGPTF